MQRFRKHSQPARLPIGHRPNSFATHNASYSRVALVSMVNTPPLTSLRTPALVATSTAACRLEAADQRWATRLLTQAGAGHPALSYVCAGPAAEQQQQWLLEQLLALALRHGGAYANAAGTALALWLGPQQTAAAWDLRLALLAATWHLGWAGQKRLRQLLRTAAWLRHQSLAEPHHLLLTVAVHPEARGRGEGRRLLAATLALRQPDLLPCQFSTQVPSQLPFYQRQGFALTGHCVVSHGPHGQLSNWSLLRPPMA